MHLLAQSITAALLLGAPFTNALLSALPPARENLLPRQTPREGLLTITALYTGDACAGPQPYWYISTGTESWFGGLEKTDGCQPVNASWAITSAKSAYLAEGCKISFYTDKQCKDNGATPPFDQCVTSTTKETWKSFAIQGCVATSKSSPV